MRTLSLFSFLLLLSNMIAGTSNCERKKPVTSPAVCLIISGKINNIGNSKESNAANSYKVELIYYNTVIESVIKKDNKSFKFNLKKNSIYTIRISKQGYISRLISIDTSLEEDNTHIYSFHFDTILFEDTQKKNLDEEALEFPIALISYNYDGDSFYFNETYTANIKKSIFEK